MEGIWVLSGQAFAMVGALVGIRLLTELLDPVAYGQLALAMTAVMLLEQTSLGPLGHGVVRYFSPAEESRDLAGYLVSAFRLVGVVSLGIGVILAAAGAVFLFQPYTQWYWLLVAACALALVGGYNTIMAGIQNAARNRKVFAVHQGLDSWLRFLAAAVLIYFLGPTSTVAMFGYVLATCLILIPQFGLFYKLIIRRADWTPARRDWRSQIFSFSWPFAAFGVFSWGQAASGRWALEGYGATEDVGYYAVLFQLGYYPIFVGVSTAIQFLAPVFYGRAGDASDARRTASVRRMNRNFTVLCLVATLGVFLIAYLFHAEIFSIFVAAEYASVSYLLPWVMLSSGIFAAGQAIALNLMSHLQTQNMVTVKVVTALLGIAANVVGAYLYGVEGIVIAGFIYAVPHSLWLLSLARRLDKGKEQTC